MTSRPQKKKSGCGCGKKKLAPKTHSSAQQQEMNKKKR